MGNHQYAFLRCPVTLFVMVCWNLCAESTQAAVEVVIVSAPPAVADYSDREIELPQFNSSLGFLESVTIDFQGTGAFVQVLHSPAEAQSHGELSEQESLSLLLETGEGEKLISLRQSVRHPNCSLRREPGSDWTTVETEPVTVSGQKTLTAEDDLMQFTGSGLVDLFLSARSGDGGEEFLDGFWTAGADIKLVYNYTAVPENSTWLTSVFAGLLLVRRARCRNISSED